jgi:CDP-diacylglycerol---serine O-phosphatidyltransferase
VTTPWQSRIPVLPTLITLGSLLCGFGAIVTATLTKEGVPQINRIEFAAWLVLVAMIFDALDGRVARMSNQVSEFGGELDSLCDAISFGVAPGVVALAAMTPYCHNAWETRLAWAASALFAVCAVLRLARFNVATKPDEESHRTFQGLPSPSAAGMIVSFVILHANLVQAESFEWVGWVVVPALLVTVGPLMVSRVRYVHLIGELTRGERSFPFFLGLVFLVFLVLLLKEYIIPVIFTTYVLSGLVGVAIDRVLDRIDLSQNRDSFAR